MHTGDLWFIWPIDCNVKHHIFSKHKFPTLHLKSTVLNKHDNGGNSNFSLPRFSVPIFAVFGVDDHYQVSSLLQVLQRVFVGPQSRDSTAGDFRVHRYHEQDQLLLLQRLLLKTAQDAGEGGRGRRGREREGKRGRRGRGREGKG